MQRFIVVGMGKMGLMHAALLNVLPDAEVVALCDLDSKLGPHVQSIGLQAPFFRSLDEALAAVSADGVYVCTPQFSHRAVAETGLKHNLHVFVEKPLAHTLEDAQIMYEQAQGHPGLVHAVGYMKRHYPLYEELGRIVADGTLGTVHHVRASLYLSQVFAPKSGWFYTPERSGGGIVINSTCHLLSLLYTWFGEVGGVFAKTMRLYSLAVEDTATAMLEFRNGVVATVHTSWSLPDFRVEETEILIEGSNGIVIADDNHFRLHLLTAKRRYPQGWTVRHRSDVDHAEFNLSTDYGGEGYYNEDLDFVRNCMARQPARVTWHDGLQVQRMIDAIYRSSEEGYITLDPLMSPKASEA